MPGRKSTWAIALPQFPPSSPLDEIVAALTNRSAPPRLTPLKPFSEALRKQLVSLKPESALGEPPQDFEEARALISGLLLWNDCLTDSHALLQQIETPTGSYWHGILHRREPDYANAKHWFKRVGQHEAFAELYRLATNHLKDPVQQISGAASLAEEWLAHLQVKGQWDPFHFVDLCHKHTGNALTEWLLAELQEIEVRVLLNFCANAARNEATGGNDAR